MSTTETKKFAHEIPVSWKLWRLKKRLESIENVFLAIIEEDMESNKDGKVSLSTGFARSIERIPNEEIELCIDKIHNIFKEATSHIG